MKIALIGDPHFANHKVFGRPTSMPGVNTRLRAVRRTMQWIANDLEGRDVWHGYILGDITHHHGVLTPAIANQIEMSLLDLLTHLKTLSVFTGNHDMDLNGSSIVPFVGGDVSKYADPGTLRLIEGLAARKYDKFVVWCASYGTDPADLNIDMGQRFGPEKLTRIALMHHSFEGAVHGHHEFSPPGGIKPSDIMDDVLVWSGHYHKKQTLGGGRIRYTGAPLQHDFGEADYTPGYTILDLRTDGTVSEEFVEVPNKVAPRFHILPHDLSDPFPGLPETDYYRIDLPSDVDPLEISKMVDGLQNVIVKPVPMVTGLRSRVEEYLSEIEDDEARPVELVDTIDAYTAMHVEDAKRAELLAQLGKDLVQEAGE